jgi:hypothetical protein
MTTLTVNGLPLDDSSNFVSLFKEHLTGAGQLWNEEHLDAADGIIEVLHVALGIPLEASACRAVTTLARDADPVVRQGAVMAIQGSLLTPPVPTCFDAHELIRMLNQSPDLYEGLQVEIGGVEFGFLEEQLCRTIALLGPAAWKLDDRVKEAAARDPMIQRIVAARERAAES